MKFGGIGIPELLIILAVVLLIFGPKNLPKLGAAIGKTVRNLRDGVGDAKKEAAAKKAEEAEAAAAVETVEPVEAVVEEVAAEPEPEAAAAPQTTVRRVVKIKSSSDTE